MTWAFALHGSHYLPRAQLSGKPLLLVLRFPESFHHVLLRAVIGVIAAKNGEVANLSPILREESSGGRKDHQSGSCRAA
jgi:hypothetical protein